jgi:serine phosphatase RsbU (regulator of sigma subunit)
VVRPNNCAAPADIIWRIDERLVQVFEGRKTNDSEIKDGCDIAVLFIAKDGKVTLSSGHINVFVCNGKEVQRIKGQKIFVGEGNLNSKDDIKTIHIPADPANKFYIASDGLFDQPGGATSGPFGYKAFEKIILENHAEKQSTISDKIWAAFEEYRGVEPRVDDFELIMFKPQEGIVSHGK